MAWHVMDVLVFFLFAKFVRFKRLSRVIRLIVIEELDAGLNVGHHRVSIVDFAFPFLFGRLAHFDLARAHKRIELFHSQLVFVLINRN